LFPRTCNGCSVHGCHVVFVSLCVIPDVIYAPLAPFSLRLFFPPPSVPFRPKVRRSPVPHHFFCPRPTLAKAATVVGRFFSFFFYPPHAVRCRACPCYFVFLVPPTAPLRSPGCLCTPPPGPGPAPPPTFTPPCRFSIVVFFRLFLLPIWGNFYSRYLSVLMTFVPLIVDHYREPPRYYVSSYSLPPSQCVASYLSVLCSTCFFFVCVVTHGLSEQNHRRAPRVCLFCVSVPFTFARFFLFHSFFRFPSCYLDTEIFLCSVIPTPAPRPQSEYPCRSALSRFLVLLFVRDLTPFSTRSSTPLRFFVVSQPVSFPQSLSRFDSVLDRHGLHCQLFSTLRFRAVMPTGVVSPSSFIACFPSFPRCATCHFPHPFRVVLLLLSQFLSHNFFWFPFP